MAMRVEWSPDRRGHVILKAQTRDSSTLWTARMFLSVAPSITKSVGSIEVVRTTFFENSQLV